MIKTGEEFLYPSSLTKMCDPLFIQHDTLKPTENINPQRLAMNALLSSNGQAEEIFPFNKCLLHLLLCVSVQTSPLQIIEANFGLG